MSKPQLHVEGDEVTGEVALAIAPGTTKDVQNRALDAALAGPLAEIAESQQVALAASPSAFAKPLPGKDEQGRTRFSIRGRIEGERLLPVRGR